MVSVSKPFDKVFFYVVAHADDWQLFMQPNVYNSLLSADKNVYIITTAGDAGFEENFWRAREEGIKSSLRFALAPCMALVEAKGAADFNNHPISYWSVNNATCYFFRLPDGNLDGKGFQRYGNSSLSKLKAGEMNNISAVDNSTIYNSWSDFYNTLQMIVVHESSRIASRWIGYQNPDTVTNPGDHPDHIATGQAVQSMPVVNDLCQALFTCYSVAETQEKLNTTDLFWKAGMFAAYEKAVFDACGYSTLREGIQIYQKWCLSNASYITIEPTSKTT